MGPERTKNQLEIENSTISHYGTDKKSMATKNKYIIVIYIIKSIYTTPNTYTNSLKSAAKYTHFSQIE